MRTASRETAPQIALRNCSKEEVAEGQYTRFGEGEFQCSHALTLRKVFCQSPGADVTMMGFSAFLDMKRCKDWDHEITS